MGLTSRVRVLAGGFPGFDGGVQEVLHHLWALGQCLVGGEYGQGIDVEALVAKGQHHDFLAKTLGLLVLVVVVGGQERSGVHFAVDQQRCHGGAVNGYPLNLVGIGVGLARHHGEVKLVAVTGRDGNFLAFQAGEIGNARVFAHKQGMGRVREGGSNGLDGSLAVLTRGQNGGNIGQANIGRAASHFQNCVTRTGATGNLQVDAVFFVNPVGNARVIRGIVAGGDEVQHEMNVVSGVGGGRSGGQSQAQHRQGASKQGLHDFVSVS